MFLVSLLLYIFIFLFGRVFLFVQNDLTEKEQRWGAKTVVGSGHQEHIKWVIVIIKTVVSQFLFFPPNVCVTVVCLFFFGEHLWYNFTRAATNDYLHDQLIGHFFSMICLIFSTFFISYLVTNRSLTDCFRFSYTKQENLLCKHTNIGYNDNKLELYFFILFYFIALIGYSRSHSYHIA